MIENHTLMRGDCFELFRHIPDNSIDLVLTDPPYGVTACKWDTVLDLPSMWTELKRVCKKRTPILLFAGQPFTSALVMSNPQWFKHTWVWNKNNSAGFFGAKYRPFIICEDICVFGNGRVNYWPIMEKREKIISVKTGRVSENYNKYAAGFTNTYTHKHPKNLLNIKSAPQKNKQHPTQKPVPLLEYLIKTYTREQQLVLDFTMGSGSTGVACVNTNRRFVGMEKEKRYFKIAKQRMLEAYNEKSPRRGL